MEEVKYMEFDPTEIPVRFEEGLKKLNEASFNELRDEAEEFVKLLDADDSAVEKLFDCIEYTKAGTIKKNAYMGSTFIAKMIPVAYYDGYGNYAVYHFYLENFYAKPNEFRVCYDAMKSYPAAKLPWKKDATAKNIPKKDIKPLHMYKDRYGKEFLFLGTGRMTKHEDFYTHALEPCDGDETYYYISKARLKKYEKYSDLTSVVTTIFGSGVNQVTSPKTFVEEIGKETRPLEKVFQTKDKGGWQCEITLD